MARPRLSSFRLAALAVVVAACAPAPSAAPVGSRGAAVYWGEDEDGYDGVVRLTIAFSLLSGAMCSGTLVSSRVVVTAQHCVFDEEGVQVAPSSILVETGPAGTRAQHVVQEIRVPDGQSLSGEDFAVVITADEVAEPPYRYTTAWDGHPGDPITLVGYGQREDGTSGRKARGDNEVGYVFDTYFTTTGEAGCHGDSGGPAFDEGGVLVGVIVNTLGGWVGEDTCLSGVSGLTRVDAFHEIVDGAIEDSWVCDDADEETCGDGRDNDCNRLIDDGCLELGAACAEAYACASGDCRDLGDGGRCTEVCAVGVAGECPDAFYCDEVVCGEGACVAGVAGAGVLGDACEVDTDCDNLACAQTGDGARCLRPCSAEAGCTEGEACADVDDDGCGGCAPNDAGAPFGAPCAAASDCASGLCEADAFGLSCATACAGGCPAGFVCDPDDHCVRTAPAAELGSPCVDAAGCVSGACEDVGGRRVCTGACDAEGACPAGLACVDAPGGPRCEPTAGVAGETCADNADCVTDLCGRFDDFRACTAECGPDAPCPGDLVCLVRGDADGEGGYCRPRTPPPPSAQPAEEDGGCGCRQSPGRPATTMGWMIVLLAVASLAGRPRHR